MNSRGAHSAVSLLRGGRRGFGRRLRGSRQLKSLGWVRVRGRVAAHGSCRGSCPSVAGGELPVGVPGLTWSSPRGTVATSPCWRPEWAGDGATPGQQPGEAPPSGGVPRLPQAARPPPPRRHSCKVGAGPPWALVPFPRAQGLCHSGLMNPNGAQFPCPENGAVRL